MKCKYYGKCGGCQIYDISYEEEIEYKLQKVYNLLKKEPEEIIKSPRIYYYRNRMDWAVGRNYEVGLKEFGKWWSYVDIDECLLQSEESNFIRNKFREFIKEKNLEPWDNKIHKGLVRYLIVREGKFTNERMIIIILYEKKNIQDFMEFVDSIKNKITSAYIGINNEISDVSYSKEKIHIFGDIYLKEKILNNTYYILPNSFFQPNSFILDKLIKSVIEYLEPKENDIIYDLYSGIGTFSIEIAKYSKFVIGVDVEKENEELFYKNSKINEIKNSKFILNKVENLDRIDGNKVVLDPPRSGLHPRVIKLLGDSNVKRIVYVSCNYETFKRDLEKLSKYRFNLVGYKIIDQFPRTVHTEIVGLLERDL